MATPFPPRAPGSRRWVSDLEPRLLEVELALDAAHDVARDLAAVAQPDQRAGAGRRRSRASSAGRASEPSSSPSSSSILPARILKRRWRNS